MPCPYCAAPATTEMSRRTTLGHRMFQCRACRRTCNERTGTPYNHLQAPTDIAVLVEPVVGVPSTATALFCTASGEHGHQGTRLALHLGLTSLHIAAYRFIPPRCCCSIVGPMLCLSARRYGALPGMEDDAWHGFGHMPFAKDQRGACASLPGTRQAARLPCLGQMPDAEAR